MRRSSFTDLSAHAVHHRGHACRSAQNVFTACAMSPRSLGTISSSRCQTTRAGETSRMTRCESLTRICFFLRTSSRWHHRWWSQTGSNRRPPACKAGALPTELWPLISGKLKSKRPPSLKLRRGSLHTKGLPSRSPARGEGWWAWEDLNFRPHAYQARALTS